MKYYHLMMLLGGFILYMLLNIYPLMSHLIKTIKKRDIKEILDLPFEIIVLLLPIAGPMYVLLTIDFNNKWCLIAWYIGIYLLLIGFIILLILLLV